MGILRSIVFSTLSMYLIIISKLTTTGRSQSRLNDNSTVPLVSNGKNSSFILNQIDGTAFNGSDTESPLLPPSWEEFCTLEETETNQSVYPYNCYIDAFSSGKWNFSELRQYIKTKDVKYSFNVRCQNGAKISLPLPGKAKNIIKLHVQDCIAEDYYADYKNPDLDLLPDELEEYVLINVVRVIGVKSMFESLQIKSANLPKNVVCGDDETLKIKTEQNETFQFIHDLINPDQASEMFSKIAAENIMDKRVSPHKCFYKKLRVLNVSVTSTKNRYYASELTEQNIFPELRVLNMSHSDLYYIPEQLKNWWIYFKKLEYLDMSHNLIQDITFPLDNDRIWDKTVPVLTFDFTHNNISRISVRNFERIISNEKILVKMGHNPINCTCTDEMKEILKYIKGIDWSSSKYHQYSYLRNLKCAYPESVRGWRLADLTLRDINCKFELMPVTVALSVLSFFLIIFIIVILKYRREIRILVYTRFNVVLPCQPGEIYEDKAFDAFVSYSNDDQEWVCNIFDENKHNRLVHLKFCMHHKDFVPGKTIFENIVKCIEESRHTVIVLSQNFLNSHFCLWEFQEAFQQSIVERKRHLIIILLEDIPDKDLPNDLKRCMKTFTYIKKDDKIFVDRLLYSLSYKGKIGKHQDHAHLNHGYDNLGE
ncbi:toll-like receptor 6 [Saccostrea echinata]|uniref:toll-like receptor 6 n=1 Tax=Saccostrea echinata TaxID=191078 RepID=UPI002A7F95DB|nr:toll-like receptor 6 [Saccostrea echinata]